MDPGQKSIIGIIGSSQPDESIRKMAAQVGEKLGQRGIILVCGGLSGIMEASCKGTKSTGGLTIGILPGHNKRDANPYVDIAIPTGIGEARNLLIIRTSQALIAIGGGYGTLSEIAFALKLGIPVIGLSTWELNKISQEPIKIIPADNPEDAVYKALAQIKK